MTGALLLTTFTAGLYYLAARAGITRWLWSRYPRPVAVFINCAACSGFWYAVGLGLLAKNVLHVEFSVLGFAASGSLWPFLAVCGAVGLVWTPIAAFAHAYAYSRLSDSEDVPDGT